MPHRVLQGGAAGAGRLAARRRIDTGVDPAAVGTELLRKVRDQLGEPYEPATTVSARTLASVVLSALEFPDDGHLMEIALRAAPSGARR
jgi:NADP-dependent 3-hydroxy acid dehydrogenase YdfG